MLDNIRAHLHSDEAVQLDIEAKAAERLQSTFAQNRRAFQRYVPAMRQQIEQLAWFNLGVFCNKDGEYNIVDQATGRTFYGLHVSNEIQTQYDNRRLDAPRHQFQTAQSEPSSGLSEQIDAIVILGTGIGHHIGQILALHQVKHCIIYEPDAQLFFASLLCFDWQKLLAESSEKKISIYFQVGQDGSNIVADLNELSEHTALNSVCIYKHYNSPTFNAIEREFRLKSWHELKHSGVQWAEYSDQAFVLPKWSTPSCLAQWQDVTAKSDPHFLKNIEALNRYFPELASEFADYQPLHWHPCRNASGDINLRSIQFPETYHGDYPRQEGLENYQVFARYPNKDGLVLGYDGTKLKEYTHYRFVSATESLIEELEEQQAALPEALKAIIVFGLTSGYSLESLVNEHSVENLFICEPEPDFFYASLFAIDWDKILTNIDVNEGRIYINVGDNGANLFRDLLSQFYAIGPYVLVNTFFYQTYYRPDLVSAVNQLREQLQVVIAMGECYDHARFGIAHTVEVIDRSVSFLRADPGRFLTYQSKEIPVFIVGNGPSLDHSIALIKEHQQRAIIVSCGTALQVLHRNGIRPDYHAEIEQNRSTFDWVTRASARDFTRQITLISCNGIHPDTCELFGNVKLAFKEGESSTVSVLNTIGADAWQKLEFAFPTVTNFVVNLFLEMQFNQLYLIGVDLGFVDDKVHHSKQSGYYDADGQEVYNYAEKNRTSLRVPGNFRKVVSTKYEFKVSKEIMEQSLVGRGADCFNCSDGALIYGSIPLQVDSVLLVSSEQQKSTAVNEINQGAFGVIAEKGTFKTQFYARYQHAVLMRELKWLEELAEQALDGQISVEELMAKQKTILHESYQSGQSLMFYLLYGTSNYSNAVFSKLLSVSGESIGQQALSNELQHALSCWLQALQSIALEYAEFPDAFDFVYSLYFQRQQRVIQRSTERRKILFLCEEQYAGRFEYVFNNYCHEAMVVENANAATSVVSESTVIVLDRSCDHYPVLNDLRVILQQTDNLHVIVASESVDAVEALRQEFPGHSISLVMMIDPIRDEKALFEFRDGVRVFNSDEIIIAILTYCALTEQQFDFLLPKMAFAAERESVQQSYLDRVNELLSRYEYCCDFPEYIVGASHKEQLLQLDGLGNRGRPFKYAPDLVKIFRPTRTPQDVEESIGQFYTKQMGGFPLE